MKKILATLVALAVLVVMAVPNVFAVTYKDPGVSTSKPVDLQFPWDANTLVTGNSASYDLNLAIGAGTLCAAAESGTSTASAVLNELGLGGAVAHYGYEANTSSVAHTISLKPVSVNGSHYNLITIVGRGSMSLADFATDMTPGAFSDNANIVLRNLDSFLAANGLTRTDPANRYFVTGHSLGGAVANIAAHRLAQSGVANSAIYGYTYASPLTVSQSDPDAKTDNNIFNLVGTVVISDAAFDNFCWGTEQTFGDMLNGNFLSVLTAWMSKGRYGTDKVFSGQSDGFYSVYETLTGKAYNANGTLAKHLVTTYLAYILEGQSVTANAEGSVRVVTINGGAPATEPTEPVTEPTEPVTEPTEPVTEPTEPVTEPTEPVTEPTEPVTEPTEPVTEPTEPVTEPTEPVTEPTEPVTEPTEPVTEPTEPVTEPTEPATQPTEPATQPSGGGSSGNGFLSIIRNVVNSIRSLIRSIFRW
ncbi:MAG: hypothetical protein IIZ60_07910 [Clostridia bacterium]|nr:hypothetical protein [Clostridia bacterium]